MTQADAEAGSRKRCLSVFCDIPFCLEATPKLICQRDKKIGPCVERKHGQKQRRRADVDQYFFAVFHDFRSSEAPFPGRWRPP